MNGEVTAKASKKKSCKLKTAVRYKRAITTKCTNTMLFALAYNNSNSFTRWIGYTIVATTTRYLHLLDKKDQSVESE